MARRGRTANTGWRERTSADEDRRRARRPSGRGAIPAVGGTRGQASGVGRLGQPDFPPWRPHAGAPAEPGGLCGAGGEGATLAPEAGRRPALADPHATGDGPAERRLPLAVVDLRLDW